MISITISLIGLIALWYIAPFSDTLMDYWYVPIVVLVYALIVQITITVKPSINDGNLNPPPEYILPIKYRIILYVIILVISLIYSLQLYIDGGVKLISNSNRYVDHFILGRFGSITSNKYMFFLQWFTIIKVIIGLFRIRDIYNFNPCDYDLPNSWSY
jgi:hypothetical protein